MFYGMPMVVVCSLVVLEVSGVVHAARRKDFKGSLKQKQENLLPIGPCWKSALGRVNEECRSLSEDSQSKMALALTNCFLKMSGHQVHGCESQQEMRARGICIGKMSDRAFNVFTNFFNQVNNMCWLLRDQIHYEELKGESLHTVNTVQSSLDLSEDIVTLTKLGVEYQKKILEKTEQQETKCNVYEMVHSSNNIIKVLMDLLRKYFSYLSELHKSVNNKH